MRRHLAFFIPPKKAYTNTTNRVIGTKRFSSSISFSLVIHLENTKQNAMEKQYLNSFPIKELI